MRGGSSGEGCGRITAAPVGYRKESDDEGSSTTTAASEEHPQEDEHRSGRSSSSSYPAGSYPPVGSESEGDAVVGILQHMQLSAPTQESLCCAPSAASSSATDACSASASTKCELSVDYPVSGPEAAAVLHRAATGESLDNVGGADLAAAEAAAEAAVGGTGVAPPPPPGPGPGPAAAGGGGGEGGGRGGEGEGELKVESSPMSFGWIEATLKQQQQHRMEVVEGRDSECEDFGWFTSMEPESSGRRSFSTWGSAALDLGDILEGGGGTEGGRAGAGEGGIVHTESEKFSEQHEMETMNSGFGGQEDGDGRTRVLQYVNHEGQFIVATRTFPSEMCARWERPQDEEGEEEEEEEEEEGKETEELGKGDEEEGGGVEQEAEETEEPGERGGRDERNDSGGGKRGRGRKRERRTNMDNARQAPSPTHISDRHTPCACAVSAFRIVAIPGRSQHVEYQAVLTLGTTVLSSWKRFSDFANLRRSFGGRLPASAAAWANVLRSQSLAWRRWQEETEKKEQRRQRHEGRGRGRGVERGAGREEGDSASGIGRGAGARSLDMVSRRGRTTRGGGGSGTALPTICGAAGGGGGAGGLGSSIGSNGSSGSRSSLAGGRKKRSGLLRNISGSDTTDDGSDLEDLRRGKTSSLSMFLGQVLFEISTPDTLVGFVLAGSESSPS